MILQEAKIKTDIKFSKYQKDINSASYCKVQNSMLTELELSKSETDIVNHESRFQIAKRFTAKFYGLYLQGVHFLAHKFKYSVGTIYVSRYI